MSYWSFREIGSLDLVVQSSILIQAFRRKVAIVLDVVMPGRIWAPVKYEWIAHLLL